MLQLRHIKKSYTTGDFTQVALDDVSVAFRDNEFVAVLGPSGSGKTTMLNIIGGLDKYDSGDLVIDGVSTKKYKDRDWDTYRNNRVGFVFQSYNLIPHQTILQNVELALTLSGVGKAERTRRAREALEKVGLGQHVNKRPNQLSGGQMQRVAIARALINDPEILLADEPTGALDSKTSVQIMDLLTEIASERLVVMVTHNPELAELYATRTVNLADGRIINDTMPYEPTAAEVARVSKKKVRRTKMSFITALGLSFNNLMTKKGRTIMTAFAGSIGIIGIAAILSLANGVNAYIASVEEETLSSYPLQITSTGFDITSMMVSSMDVTQTSTSDEGDATESSAADDAASEDDGSSQSPGSTLVFDEDTVVKEANIMNRMFDSVGSNDLASLKEYFESGESGIEEYVNDIQYIYNVTPQIFLADTSEGVQQVNPDKTFTSLGMGSTIGGGTSVMTSMMSTDVFDEIKGTLDMVKEGYDLKAGHWPEKYNECVLVLTRNGSVSDFLLYVLGLRDHDVMDEMVKSFMNNEEVVTETDDGAVFTYRSFLESKFKLVCSADFYEYDEEYGVWKDKSGDEEYMKGVIADADDLVISGIIQANSDSSSMLSTGVYYTPALTEHLIEEAGATQIVKDQLKDPTVDVFNGKSFAEEKEDKEDEEFDLSSMFTIDTGALEAAFNFDTSKISLDMDSLDIDFSSMSLPQMDGMGDMDMSSMMGDMGDMGDMDMSSMMGDMDMSEAFKDIDMSDVDMTPEIDNAKVGEMVAILMGEFQNAVVAGKVDMSEGMQSAVEQFMALPETQAIIAEYLPQIFDFQGMQERLMAQLTEKISAALADYMQQYMQQAIQKIVGQLMAQIQQKLAAAIEQYMTQYMTQLMEALTQQMSQVMRTAMEKAMSQLSSSLQSAMSIDADAFKDAFKFDMSEEDLTELVMSMMGNEEATFDGNLAKLDYAQLEKPYEIDIFPKNFEDKQKVVDVLDAYNDAMNYTGQESKAITYTDIVGALMSSVTTIVDMISYVLIAFVSISLIVSSIMIGVITYISVLERKKEIGILRAIGASKGNISQVFNAETVIEGLISGILGVGITALACIPASAIVYSLFDVPNVAQLPLGAGLVLIAISVFLTFIAGLIPASSASRKDPVEALRSE